MEYHPSLTPPVAPLADEPAGEGVREQPNVNTVAEESVNRCRAKRRISGNVKLYRYQCLPHKSGTNKPRAVG